MDRRERYNDPEEVLRTAQDGHQSRIWTALPGIIQGFDAAKMTCTVQPSIKSLVRQSSGDIASLALPILLDCPVFFPSGGGCTLTFPIAQGDECLVVFSSRCIDGWWASGGVQDQVELRMHDLSDGFVLPGVKSVPKAFSVSTSSTQLRSNDGSTYIELDPTVQKVKIVAPGGFEVDAPTSTFSGAVTVNGLFTFVAGMVGSATSGAAAAITGTINFIGELFSNSKRIDDTHTHSDPQGGNTGPVN